MTITSQDVKLYKSEIMSDVDDGGGRMTGNEVIDGQLNNVFDDTSRLDRVRGRASFRKIFGAVTTNTTEKFLGVHAILTDPPDDGRVNVTILDRDSHSDRRIDAQTAVEHYLAASTETTLTLYSNQPAGARTIVCYQEPSSPIPSVGDVLCLSIEKASDPNNGYQQFVRVSTAAVSSQTFYDGGSSYQKVIVTLGLGSALEVTFPGTDVKRQPALSDKGTHVRNADLSETSRYYGVVPLAAPISAEDTELQVSTILQSVVPASYSESPLLDQQIGSSSNALVAAGAAVTEAFSGTAAGGLLAYRTMRAARPGTISVTLDASSDSNDASFVDQGGGNLQRNGGGINTAAATGSAVYASGQLSFSGLPNVSYTGSVTYTPACQVSDVQNTAGIEITLANRGFNYAQVLTPRPAPGAVVVTYRSLGKWYTLTDNGAGQLVGAPGVGSGTVNYGTGTVNMTCGYQPDVGSHVLFGWGTGVHYAISTDNTSIDIGAINGGAAADAGILPTTAQVEYDIGETTYVVTDNGLGQWTGDGSGTIDYATGIWMLYPSVLPPSGTVFSFSAQKKTLVTEAPLGTVAGGDVSFTLSTTPVLAGSASLVAIYERANGQNVVVEFVEKDGQWRQANGSTNPNYKGLATPGAMRGTVNRTTGACVLPEVLVDAFRNYEYSLGVWVNELEDLSFVTLGTAKYVQDVGTATASTSTATQTSLGVDFSRAIAAAAVPNSMMFTLNGRRYYDVSGLLFYRDAGGAEQQGGTVDYATCKAQITAWVTGNRSVSVQSLLTVYGQWTLGHVLWRTPASPLRSQSFAVTDGTHTATANNVGTLGGASTYITGSIKDDTGVYDVTFDPPITPGVARYNAVALTYLPLDPEILGLDPVRLPLDGRVPVIQPADTLVIHHTDYETLPNPVVAGQTYDLPRGALAYAIVRDQAGTLVPTDRYSTDLDAGSVTFGNPLDLSSYTQPLIVEHRIEDMVLCLDAQLSGDLTITGLITHDFPLGAYVSSAKLIGDLQARTSVPFAQTAWTGSWSDSLQGSAPVAQYNSTSYPIQVSNRGAIAERWRIEFTSSTTFRLIGESTGVHPTIGNVNDDFAPLDLLTGETLLSIPFQGWGGGWVGGNQLRVNTFAAAAPLWLLRCTLQGPESEPDDSVRIQFRGDHQ